jgi:xanthine dehydrogenase large subunit
VGEPPLTYGIGAYSAILNAVRAFNPELELELWAPLTPQKCLTYLYGPLG